MALKSFGSSWT